MSVNRALALIIAVLMIIGLGQGSWTSILAAPPWQEALAIITSPTNAAIVRGQVPIMGSATHPAFQFFKVEFAREPVTGGDEVWSIIGAIVEQPVINGQLTVWDTRQVPDGSYSLRLRVVRIDGNYDEAFVRQVVVANAQPERPTETPTPAATPT
ncbi:MAG: hypothetical protein RMK79_13795, partial [Anaerolineae bacterium]|nr:hypothetical protein [Anaerolineae bacterium]